MYCLRKEGPRRGYQQGSEAIPPSHSANAESSVSAKSSRRVKLTPKALQFTLKNTCILFLNHAMRKKDQSTTKIAAKFCFLFPSNCHFSGQLWKDL